MYYFRSIKNFLTGHRDPIYGGKVALTITKKKVTLSISSITLTGTMYNYGVSTSDKCLSRLKKRIASNK